MCRGVLNIVMKLIERKADVNAVNASGTQALHRAAIYGNAAVVKKLVEYVLSLFFLHPCNRCTESSGRGAGHIQ